MTALIAFDWNGTLVDDAERAAAATSAVLVGRGRAPLERDAFREAFRLPLADMFRALGVPVIGLEEAEREWNARMRTGEAPLAPGARAALAAIGRRGWRAGVVSAASDDAVLADVDRLGLAGSFAFVQAGCRDKAGALRDLAAGLAPGRLVYLGDAEYDMECARDAGAIPIGYGGGYRPASALLAAGAVAVVGHYRDLAPLLDGLLGATPATDAAAPAVGP